MERKSSGREIKGVMERRENKERVERVGKERWIRGIQKCRQYNTEKEMLMCSSKKKKEKKKVLNEKDREKYRINKEREKEYNIESCAKGRGQVERYTQRMLVGWL